MLAHGAQPAIGNAKGESARMWARQSGAEEIHQMLSDLSRLERCDARALYGSNPRSLREFYKETPSLRESLLPDTVRARSVPPALSTGPCRGL